MSEQFYLEFNKKLLDDHLKKTEQHHKETLATTQAILNNKNAQMDKLRKDDESAAAANNQAFLENQKTILALESSQNARHEAGLLAINQAHTSQMKAIEEMNAQGDGGMLMKKILGGGLGFMVGGVPGAVAGAALT